MKVAGLDLSITATGTARDWMGGALTSTIATKEKDGDARLVQIRSEIIQMSNSLDAALIEAPTARSFSAVVSGMVHGVVREALIEQGVGYASVLPAALKKYATGRGGATKVDMGVQAYKRAGLEFPNDNEADAWWLWVMMKDFLGEPVLDLPKVNRESLTKIKWHWRP